MSNRTIGRHDLALVLAQHGLSYRQAYKTVGAVFETVKKALQRHESVDLGFGVLSVESQPVRTYRRWSFGQSQEVYKHRNRVVFTPRNWS
jgi:nucleoid DNA-binding protein